MNAITALPCFWLLPRLGSEPHNKKDASQSERGDRWQDRRWPGSWRVGVGYGGHQAPSPTTTFLVKSLEWVHFRLGARAWSRGGREERDQQAGSKVGFEVAMRRWWDIFHVCDDVTEHHDSFLFLAASPS